MDVRMPDGTIIRGVPEGTSQAELMRRLNKMRNPPPVEPPPNPTQGMSRTQRVLANVGAGMADLGLGARQLYTDITGTPEEQAAIQREVDEKRKRDEMLAESTTGGSLLQMAGNVAPTLAIPVGTFVRGATALPRALGLMGRAGPARLGTGTLAADAALGGAAISAVDPVATGDSRSINVASGAALSGATPLAIAGGNQVRRMVTQAGGGERAGQQIAQELGADSPQVLRQTIDRLRNAPQAAVPLTTAASLADPQLARLERGSRTRNAANWYDFDQQQAREVWNQVQGATRGANEIETRRALRTGNRAQLFNQAMSSVNDDIYQRQVGNLRQYLLRELEGPDAANDQVAAGLRSVLEKIDRPNFSPAHLAQVRADLANKMPLVPQTAIDAVPRNSPATGRMLSEIDDVLNASTNNRWSNVLSGYKRDSDIVRSAQASGKVRESFIDSATGRVRGTAADSTGDLPTVTEAGLGRALDVARGPRKELVLDPTANARLEAVLQALRQQNITRRVAKSATAGGGSNTASDTFAAEAAGNLADAVANTAGAPGRMSLDALRNFANTRKDAALAEALQNPQRMIELLEGQVRAGRPLSPAEQQLLAILRGAPAATE